MRLQGSDRLPEEAHSAAHPRPVRQPSRLRHRLRRRRPFQCCAVSPSKLPASMPATRMLERGMRVHCGVCGLPRQAIHRPLRPFSLGQAVGCRAKSGDARTQRHTGGNRRGSPHPRRGRSSRCGGRTAGLLRLPAPHLHASGGGPRVRGHRALGALPCTCTPPPRAAVGRSAAPHLSPAAPRLHQDLSPLLPSPLTFAA